MGPLSALARPPPPQFGPLLTFVGNYLPPFTASNWDGKYGDDRRRSLLAEGAAAGNRSADAVGAAALLKRKPAPPPVDTTYYQFPTWCRDAGPDWFVENRPLAARLEPADLHAAMVATREQRLGE